MATPPMFSPAHLRHLGLVLLLVFLVASSPSFSSAMAVVKDGDLWATTPPPPDGVACSACASCANPCQPLPYSPRPPSPPPPPSECPPPPSPPAEVYYYYSPPPPSTPAFYYYTPPPPSSGGYRLPPPPPSNIVPYFPYYTPSRSSRLSPTSWGLSVSFLLFFSPPSSFIFCRRTLGCSQNGLLGFPICPSISILLEAIFS